MMMIFKKKEFSMMNEIEIRILFLMNTQNDLPITYHHSFNIVSKLYLPTRFLQ